MGLKHLATQRIRVGDVSVAQGLRTPARTEGSMMKAKSSCFEARIPYRHEWIRPLQSLVTLADVVYVARSEGLEPPTL